MHATQVRKMRTTRTLLQIRTIALCLLTATLCTPKSQAQQVVNAFGVTKTGYFVQNDDGPAVPDAGENHYFDAFAAPDPLAEIESAVLGRPTGGQIDLMPFLFYFEGFNSQAALDARFGNGTYTFQVATIDFDFFTAQLSLSGGFPTVPRLTNFTAAQSINAGADFTLGWEAFANGTVNDFIRVTVDDAEGFTVFDSPDYGDAGALTGTDISAMIPANTLKSGSNYVCYLTFNRFADLQVVEGAQGTALYTRETTVPLRTAPGGGTVSVNFAGFSRLQNGSFQLQVTGTAGATFTLQATADFTSWTTLVTTNPPSGSFTFADTGAANQSRRFYRVQAN